MKSKLDALRDRKDKLETIVHQDTSVWPANTLKSFQTAQRNAQKELDQISMEIGNILLSTSKTVYLKRNDPVAPMLIKEIKNSDRFVTVDFLVIEKMIVNKIWPDKTTDFRFSTDTSLYIDKVLTDIALQIGAQYLDRTTLKAKHLGTKNDKLGAILNVESIVSQTFGQELKALYLVKGIYDAVSAIDKENTKAVIFNLPEDQKDLSDFIKEFRHQNVDLFAYTPELLGEITPITPPLVSVVPVVTPPADLTPDAPPADTQNAGSDTTAPATITVAAQPKPRTRTTKPKEEGGQ